MGGFQKSIKTQIGSSSPWSYNAGVHQNLVSGCLPTTCFSPGGPRLVHNPGKPLLCWWLPQKPAARPPDARLQVQALACALHLLGHKTPQTSEEESVKLLTPKPLLPSCHLVLDQSHNTHPAGEARSPAGVPDSLLPLSPMCTPSFCLPSRARPATGQSSSSVIASRLVSNFCLLPSCPFTALEVLGHSLLLSQPCETLLGHKLEFWKLVGLFVVCVWNLPHCPSFCLYLTLGTWGLFTLESQTFGVGGGVGNDPELFQGCLPPLHSCVSLSGTFRMLDLPSPSSAFQIIFFSVHG